MTIGLKNVIFKYKQLLAFLKEVTPFQKVSPLLKTPLSKGEGRNLITLSSLQSST